MLYWIWEFWVVGANGLEMNKIDMIKVLEIKKKNRQFKLFACCEISSIFKSKGSGLNEVAND